MLNALKTILIAAAIVAASQAHAKAPAFEAPISWNFDMTETQPTATWPAAYARSGFDFSTLDRMPVPNATVARFLAAERGKPTDAQIRDVNDFANARPYVTDMDNYGTPDHWATPAEFFARGGDCEDYAIAKFFLLRKLGVAHEHLFITFTVPAAGESHALLTINVVDHLVILDLRGPPRTEHESAYRPAYSINRFALWQYDRKGR